MQNLLTNIPAQLPGELFTTLLENNHIKIERIVSRGHHSPENYWYDQDQHEWLVLIQGAARIGYPDSQSTELQSGDYLHIPAHSIKASKVDVHLCIGKVTKPIVLTFL